MHVPVGWVPGHVPHVQFPPTPPPPPAVPTVHVQSVVPYTHGCSEAHAPTTGVQVPVGCVPGHAVHVVHVHTGFAPPMPPAQSHTASP